MGASRRDIVIALTCLVSGVLLSAIFFGAFGRRWQASGDGRTIYNTRTGELRYTYSGESVKEVRERKEAKEASQTKRAQQEAGMARLIDRELAEEEAERAKARLLPAMNQTRQTIAKEGVSGLKEDFLFRLWSDTYDLQSAGLVSEELASEAKQWVERKRKRNEEVFEQLKEFVNKHPKLSDRVFTSVHWEPATRPFRIADSLKPPEKERLLEVLGTAITKVEEKYILDCERAIGLLREYEARWYTIVLEKTSSWEEYKESLLKSSH